MSADVWVSDEVADIVRRWLNDGCYVYLHPEKLRNPGQIPFAGPAPEDNIGWKVKVEFRNVNFIQIEVYDWDLITAVEKANDQYEQERSEGAPAKTSPAPGIYTYGSRKKRIKRLRTVRRRGM